MPFGKIPKKNPGRYFEQFVKVTEPKQGSSMTTSPAVAYCNNSAASSNSPGTGWSSMKQTQSEYREWKSSSGF